jgi:hypothetical protein
MEAAASPLDVEAPNFACFSATRRARVQSIDAELQAEMAMATNYKKVRETCTVGFDSANAGTLDKGSSSKLYCARQRRRHGRQGSSNHPGFLCRGCTE